MGRVGIPYLRSGRKPANLGSVLMFFRRRKLLRRVENERQPPRKAGTKPTKRPRSTALVGPPLLVSCLLRGGGSGLHHPEMLLPSPAGPYPAIQGPGPPRAVRPPKCEESEPPHGSDHRGCSHAFWRDGRASSTHAEGSDPQRSSERPGARLHEPQSPRRSLYGALQPRP